MTTDLREAARELLDALKNVRIYGESHALTKIWLAHDAALTALAAEDWSPIETAPKDGTEILGYRNGRYANASRVQRDDCEMWSFGPVSGEVTMFPSCKPTHWRPLPDPPTLAASQEQQP